MCFAAAFRNLEKNRVMCGFRVMCPDRKQYIILLLEIFPWQLEVLYQFFVGSFDETGTYVDDIGTIAKNYVFSYNGFWFDAITSVPWSFLDLYSYQVSAVPKPLKIRCG